MTNYGAILFDFDYTLGDDTDTIFAGFSHAMASLGRAVPEREAVRRTVGMPLEDAFTQLTGEVGEEARRQFRAYFLEKTLPLRELGDTPLCPGAKELLTDLVGRGIFTAVVSTKQTSVLQRILARHGLGGTLSFVVGGDMVERPKPDPQGLNMAIARLDLSPGDILYCGDTVIDAETAQRAGADFCAVLNGTTPAEAFGAFPHRYVAADLFALRRWLEL